MLQLWRSMLDCLRVHNNLEGAELLVFLFLLQESHLPKLLQLGTGRILSQCPCRCACRECVVAALQHVFNSIDQLLF